MLRRVLAAQFALLLWLAPARAVAAQDAVKARRVDRYEYGASYDEIKEAAYRLTGHIGGRGDRVAVRVCSKEPLPLAFATAAANPFDVANVLIEQYAYAPKRVVSLRSEDCASPDPRTPATEIWAVPAGEPLPAHVEAAAADQLRLKALGAGGSPITGHRDYRQAARRLAAALKSDPDAVGVVLGYYIHKPRPAMSRRLREVTAILRQNGVARGRFFVRLTPWTDYVSTYPREEPEPLYPSVFEVVWKGRRRDVAAASATTSGAVSERSLKLVSAGPDARRQTRRRSTGSEGGRNEPK